MVTLSDLLIVLNPDQLDSIPKMSRLNSADIIQTRYANTIEGLSNNIPFYKVSINTKLYKLYKQNVILYYIFRVVNYFWEVVM